MEKKMDKLDVANSVEFAVRQVIRSAMTEILRNLIGTVEYKILAYVSELSRIPKPVRQIIIWQVQKAFEANMSKFIDTENYTKELKNIEFALETDPKFRDITKRAYEAKKTETPAQELSTTGLFGAGGLFGAAGLFGTPDSYAATGLF